MSLAKRVCEIEGHTQSIRMEDDMTHDARIFRQTRVGIDSHTKEQAVNSQTEEPTLASTWYGLDGSPLTDEVLEWPADLFALTNVILKRTEAYRFVLSPPDGVNGRQVGFLAGPTRSRTWAGSGAYGSRIGRVHSLAFWPRSGEPCASGPGRRSNIWQRGATGGCVRQC